MNSILSKNVKISLIVIAFLISFFMVFVWIFGPVQNSAYLNKLLLDKIYSHSALKSCEIITNTQLSDEDNLAQCYVNETFVVWLNVTDEGKIQDRLNWDKTLYEENMNLLKQRYNTSVVEFSYYQKQFVYDVKTNEEEFFLSISDLTKVFSVKK